MPLQARIVRRDKDMEQLFKLDGRSLFPDGKLQFLMQRDVIWLRDIIQQSSARLSSILGQTGVASDSCTSAISH